MNDELTTRLTRQLHDQVDDWHTAPLSLDSVRGRARSIRRTRRAAAGGAVAAVLAIAVPGVLFLGGAHDAGPDRDLPPVTNTNTPDSSPTQGVDTNTPEPGTVAGPAIPFLVGDELNLPGGATVTLPEPYQGGTVLGETFFGLRSDDAGNLVLDELDAQQQVVDTVPVDSGIVANLEGDAFAYVSDRELVIRWEGGENRLGNVGAVQMVRLVGGPDCTLGADDCVVYFNDGETPRFVNNSGETAEVGGDPLSLEDVDDERRVAMLTTLTPEPGSCGRVFDLQRLSEAFSTCEHTLGRFSADGELISAAQPYQDGFGGAFYAILDSTSGDELARYTPAEGGSVYYSVWEDPENLLVLSYEDGSWLVTRLGADGSSETVLGPVEGTQEEPAYALLGASF